MIRGITKGEDELKQKRVLTLRKLVKTTWVGTIFALFLGVILPFLDYERPGAGSAPKNSFAVIINRANRERPAIHGSLVRLVAGKGYILTVAGNVVKEADLGKAVEIWFPWLVRDRTVPGTVKVIHQTRSSPPEPGYSPYLAVVEFDAPPQARSIEISGESLDSLGDAGLEVWGVEMKSLKVAKLAGPRPLSKIYGNGYFAFSLGIRDYPYGGAVVAKGKLVGVVADMRSARPAGGVDQAIGIGAEEIRATITKAIGQ
jgi:hypothetical protein